MEGQGGGEAQGVAGPPPKKKNPSIFWTSMVGRRRLQPLQIFLTERDQSVERSFWVEINLFWKIRKWRQKKSLHSESKKGDQNWPFFAQRVIVYFGQFF
jgi:hypothetical protein